MENHFRLHNSANAWVLIKTRNGHQLEIYPEARDAGRALIQEGERHEPRRKTYLYVNNRLEGNALATIAAMVELVA